MAHERASQATIDDFLAQRCLALVGASRSGRKFGNAALRELRNKGYRVFPVHPEAAEIDGVSCFRSLSSLPEPVGGVLVVVPPAQAERVVAEAAAASIGRVWLQQGAESAGALEAARSGGMQVVHGECILMFAQPTAFFHRAHRWVNGLFGRLPAQTSPSPPPSV